MKGNSAKNYNKMKKHSYCVLKTRFYFAYHFVPYLREAFRQQLYSLAEPPLAIPLQRHVVSIKGELMVILQQDLLAPRDSLNVPKCIILDLIPQARLGLTGPDSLRRVNHMVAATN